VSVHREQLAAVLAGLRARETSLAAFYGGVLRHRVLARRDIWVGSRTVIEGAERISVRPGGSLRIGTAPLSLTSRHDSTVLRIGPTGALRCNGLVSIQRGARIVVGGRLTIGHGTNVNGVGCRIACSDAVTIGEHCTLAWDTQVLDDDFHVLTAGGERRARAAPVRIGDRVWLGAGAIVLKGVTIGDGSVVGAGAVVTGDLPGGVVAAGVPARVVGEVDSWE
jgi:tetrahydrodipicolinate N-acetyltransferase